MSRSRSLLASLGAFVLLATLVPAATAAPGPSGPAGAADTAVSGRVLVSWQPWATAADRAQVRRAHGLATEEAVGPSGVEVLTIPDQTPAHVAERLAAVPAVAVAEPDLLLESTAVDDPGFDVLWGLHNTGQDGGEPDVDVDAPEAWQYTTGDPGIVVAVIDTGVDITHPDLAPNVWTNPGEVAGNGVDDDGNGYVDDVHGWDFLNDDASVYDDASEDFHGTHVAGTIAAAADNGIGVAGVAPNVTVMPLKALGGSDGAGTTSDALEAIDYAVRHGAHVINASWGGVGESQLLRDAIARATGTVVVAGAGNEATDNDTTPYYPAEWARNTHGIGNVLSVGSVTRTGQWSSFSNFGDQSVDVGAPGSAIVSTMPDGAYGWSSGTSMATPHASAIAALAASLDPALTGAQLVDAVKAGAAPLPALATTTTTGGLVNAAATLAAMPSPEPLATGSASGELAAGETLTTDTAGTGATTDVPVQTSVTVPVAGTVEITAGSPSTDAGDGWSLLDVEVDVTAPTGTATDPLVLRFHLDGSLDPDGVVAFRNGTPVAECPGAATASPDPCVTARGTDGDDTVLTVLTSRAGTFHVGRATTACPASRVPAAGFDDLAGGVHAPAIDCMAWWGIANGLTVDRFAPSRSVTRGQMASFVARTIRESGEDLPAGTDAFSDDDGSVHEADIDALAAAGIANGLGDGQYAPDRAVSRAEMAAFLVRTETHRVGTTLVGTSDAFVDDDASVHEAAIDAAFDAGLVRGTGIDTYDPARAVTRAEMATFLSRLLDRMVALELARTPV